MTMRRFALMLIVCSLPAAAVAWTAAPVFRVHLLGTGNPMPSFERFGNATLVQAGERYLLVDAGRGAFLRLGQVAVASNPHALLPAAEPDPVLAVDLVLLTHLHSDHIVGLPDVWLSGWLYRQHRPLRIRGPDGTERHTRHLREAYDFDIDVRRDTGARLPGTGATFVAQDVAEGLVLEDGELKVTAILVDHAPIEPALGYRIDYAGRSVVISGDTRPSDDLVEASRGSDVLIHEVIAVEDELAGSARIRTIVSHHTTARQAGTIFERSRPRLAVFSHIVLIGDVQEATLEAQTREAYDGPLWTGADLDIIDIGREISVLRGDTRTVLVEAD